MTEAQRKFHKETVEKQKRSIERWKKSPLSPEEMMEQSRRLARSLELINKGYSAAMLEQWLAEESRA